MNNKQIFKWWFKWSLTLSLVLTIPVTLYFSWDSIGEVTIEEFKHVKAYTKLTGDTLKYFGRIESHLSKKDKAVISWNALADGIGSPSEIYRRRSQFEVFFLKR